jgi:hypothetical protein
VERWARVQFEPCGRRDEAASGEESRRDVVEGPPGGRARGKRWSVADGESDPEHAVERRGREDETDVHPEANVLHGR